MISKNITLLERQVSKYLLSQVLGSGAFGKVYLAKSRTDKNCKRAIKALPKEKIVDVESFKNEIEILSKLVCDPSLTFKDHPNVIRLIEVFEDPKRVYLVQE